MTQETEDVVLALRLLARGHKLDAVPVVTKAADLLERLSDRIDVLEGVLEPFAEVAAWAERNGHDLSDFDMLLRGPQTQIAGHLQVQADDFIRARAALHQEGIDG